MLKSEDQEFKSRHLAADPVGANDASFGILTGVQGLVDQFELDDARNGGDMSIKVQGMTWGASRTLGTSWPGEQ